MSLYCKECNSLIPDGSEFCIQCGARISLDKNHIPDLGVDVHSDSYSQNKSRKCPSCGAKVPDGCNFCIECGTPIGGDKQIKLENEKKQQYDELIEKFNKAEDESTYMKVAEELKQFFGFENADETYKKCLEQAEVCKKDKIYSNAIAIFTEKPTYKKALKAIELLQSLDGWKDSLEQIDKINEQLASLEIEDSQRKKKITLISIIAGIVVLIGIGAAFGIKTYLDVQRLSKEFDSKVTELNSTKESLENNIQEADKILVANAGSQESLNSLKTAIDSAKELQEINIPEKEKLPSKLKNQISDLQDQIDNYEEKNTKLLDAMSAVTKSIDDQKNLEAATTGVVSTTVKNYDGYTFKVTWTLGKWIKASDASAIKNAWEILGGTGDVPYISKFGNSSGYTVDKAMILIGKCYIENITEGYSISSNSDVTVNAKVSVKYMKPSTSKSYETSSSFKMLAEVNNGQEFVNGSINAKLNGNTWGPVTFAIAVPNVFMPNNTISPSEYFLKFDDNTIANIALSW